MNFLITFILVIAALIVGAILGVWCCSIGFYQQIADGILIPAEEEYDCE